MSEIDDSVTVEDLKGSVQGILTTADDGNAAGGSAAAAAAAASASLGRIGRDVVMRVPVTVQVVLGKLRMPVSELMQLTQGSVIALDRSLGEPVDLVVNGHLVARGQIIVVEDKSKRFGISLTEIVDSSVAS